MSYDAHMEIDTGGDEPAIVKEIGSYTYNVSPMFQEALGCSLTKLTNQKGRDLIPVLENAISDIEDLGKRELYHKMNPSNGWGNRQGASDYLSDILHACRNHPLATLRIH